MDDVISALRDRRAKAEAKIARANKALEIAKKELLDLEAAERVIASITGESISPPATGGSVSERDRAMAKLLPVSADSALSPVDLHQIYLEETGDDLNLDAFRTALWRLSKKAIRGESKNWEVRSKGGRYWREAVNECQTEEYGSPFETE